MVFSNDPAPLLEFLSRALAGRLVFAAASRTLFLPPGFKWVYPPRTCYLRLPCCRALRPLGFVAWFARLYFGEAGASMFRLLGRQYHNKPSWHLSNLRLSCGLLAALAALA